MAGDVNCSCDIWSLGCTVFELLTGAPPYLKLNQYSAMIKIVEQDMVNELPEGISSELNDFLTKCFQKEPSARPTAAQLIEHPWLVKMA